jgi:muconate cycloisomerase
VRLAEPAYPEFLEQPVAGNDFDGMARVAGASTIPVGADEGIHALQDVRRLILSGAAAGGSFKIMKLGGISRCMAAIRLCTALGGSVNISGKLGESSLANAATLALAAAVGQPRWGLSLTHHYLADDVVRRPLSIRQGFVRPPDGPGFGVELDEAKLSRFQIGCATGLDHPHQPEEVRKAEAPTA